MGNTGQLELTLGELGGNIPSLRQIKGIVWDKATRVIDDVITHLPGFDRNVYNKVIDMQRRINDNDEICEYLAVDLKKALPEALREAIVPSLTNSIVEVYLGIYCSHLGLNKPSYQKISNPFRSNI